MNNQEIGKVIKSLRIEQHLTQKQLADRLNISDKTISKWEGGYGCPEITLWPLLAEVFKVPVDTLLKGELVLCVFSRMSTMCI
ncbi:hypothetical protein SDC9_128118 [bioreactor metagenome]|uniref:HTH cro/C1-type domain-containing protein n=1 Tax=bioreactor metagenome TaxID=1076179 RepID=A0A645CVA3_9ZZZZ